ncbi:hypothetical protein T4B_1009 [Trichinella pseudospiralis]|uniref:Uncharacterized protein n=1 Tax=Trichinella pseudospiralis TaxID=6337 RepID=A0A0V1IQY2_TRIPS|nr:hypothetical protein T4B_1009 [Trichinella pseudospiralis]KRZ40166.1 hypothetical protein T4C_4509 [Trichinella pseudospiralis]
MQIDSVGIDRDWNENTNNRLATTIDCLPWTTATAAAEAAAAAGQIVSVCSARIQKEQMFLRSMSPAVAFLHHLLCIGLLVERFQKKKIKKANSTGVVEGNIRLKNVIRISKRKKINGNNVTYNGGAGCVAGAMTASVAANRLSTMVVVGRLARWSILSAASSVHLGIWPPVGLPVGRSVGWSVFRLTKSEGSGETVSSDEAVFIQLHAPNRLIDTLRVHCLS